MDKKKTGLLIKEARTKKKYTQSELGDLIGVTNKAVSRWENGESFPDVGVLESLSNILDLRIRDIVLGENSETDEKAVLEVIRIAKLQNRTRNGRILKILLIGVIVILYSCLLGWTGLFSYGNNAWNAIDVYGISYAVIMFLLLMMLKKEEKYVLMGKRKLDLVMLIVSATSFICEVMIMGISFSVVGMNKMPFNLEAEMIGSFLNTCLVIIFLINLIIIVSALYSIIKDERIVCITIFIATAMLFMSGVNGALLHRLSTFDTALRLLWENIIVISMEMLITIVVGICVTKKSKQTELEN